LEPCRIRHNYGLSGVSTPLPSGCARRTSTSVE
jgi:hypothetical protein